jgi:hypothetical protein
MASSSSPPGASPPGASTTSSDDSASAAPGDDNGEQAERLAALLKLDSKIKKAKAATAARRAADPAVAHAAAIKALAGQKRHRPMWLKQAVAVVKSFAEATALAVQRAKTATAVLFSRPASPARMARAARAAAAAEEERRRLSQLAQRFLGASDAADMEAAAQLAQLAAEELGATTQQGLLAELSSGDEAARGVAAFFVFVRALDDATSGRPDVWLAPLSAMLRGRGKAEAGAEAAACVLCKLIDCGGAACARMLENKDLISALWALRRRL